jgi:hypothetical protein
MARRVLVYVKGRIMMKMLLAGGALGLCLSGVANAATYDVIYDGDTADFTAQIVTDGSDQVTSITGWFDDGSGHDAITGFLPGNANGLWQWDNEFGAVATWVDWYGVLFTTAAGVSANLFYDAGKTVLSYNPGNYIPGAIGTLTVETVAPVPLPAAGLLLVGALGALGAARRRKAA